MLYRLSQNPTSIPDGPRAVSGRRLAPSRMTPSRRAGIAAQLLTGELRLADITVDQACALTGANPTYVRKALQTDPRERDALARGHRSMSYVRSSLGRRRSRSPSL